MKIILKILLSIIVLLLLATVFFLEIIPSNATPTKEQEVFCQTHSCGIISQITAFEFMKNYFKK